MDEPALGRKASFRARCELCRSRLVSPFVERLKIKSCILVEKFFRCTEANSPRRDRKSTWSVPVRAERMLSQYKTKIPIRLGVAPEWERPGGNKLAD